MNQPKKLKLDYKLAVSAYNLNPKDWMLLKDGDTYITIIHKTTSTSVERAIRHAITKVDLGNWNGCYARSACTNLQNSEFLYTLALKIKQED